MTREEIEKFVMATINDYDIHEATRRIADHWEEDKEAASDAAFTRGQHSMHPF